MLRMKNGDYVPKGSGLETVSGSEAVLQRVLLRLTARRGAFPFMESFGSRLWTLGQLKAAERQAAAEQYVAEALADEEGLSVTGMELAEKNGFLELRVLLRYENETGEAVVTIGGE